MIRNKKGDVTMDNFISVVIAVLIIAGIIYGIIKIATIFTDQESRNAKNSLDLLVGRLKSLEGGQKADFVIQGFKNSENWFIAGWSAGEAGRPDKCYFDSCLCACPLSAVGANAAEKCQSKGTCQKLTYERVSVEPIKTEDAGATRERFVLPVNVDECKLEIVKNSDGTLLAKVQMNPVAVAEDVDYGREADWR